ncbi:hypothetical protein VPH35_005781 [Triticum aestivum]
MAGKRSGGCTVHALSRVTCEQNAEQRRQQQRTHSYLSLNYWELSLPASVSHSHYSRPHPPSIHPPPVPHAAVSNSNLDAANKGKTTTPMAHEFSVPGSLSKDKPA